MGVRMKARFGSRSVWHLTVLPLVLALSIGLAACGGGGASDEELAEAEKAGIAKERQKQRLDNLEAKLKQGLKDLKKGQGSKGSAPNPPSTAPAPAPAPSSSEGNCGGTLSVNSVTTCEFAENVRFAYEAEVGSGSGSIEAFSPARGTYYSMYCSGGSPVECTGGDEAWVSFP